MAIDERLGLSRVEGVGGGHVEQVPSTVEPNISRVHDGALEGGWIAQSVLATGLLLLGRGVQLAVIRQTI